MISRVYVTKTQAYIPGSYQVVQASNRSPVEGEQEQPSFDKTTEQEIICPYGMASTPPLKASGIKLNVGGESSNQVAIFYDPKTIPPHHPNEAVFGAFAAPVPTYMRFTNKGTIEIWKGGVLVIADLITHIHTGGTLGGGLTGTPTI